MRFWKVGELARSTGLTVRTLHHYDDIGLLSPSRRSPSGYRLYTAADVERLQRVISLRGLGMSLEEIRSCLDRPEYSLRRVVGLHIEQLRSETELRQRLCRMLERLARRLDAAEVVSVDEFLQMIEAITMFNKYLTSEQSERIEARRLEVGEERIREVEAEWPVLIGEVRAAMEAGTPAEDPSVQALARRWAGLVREFTGGDAGIANAVHRMYENEPTVRERSAIDAAMFEYISKAQKAARAEG